MVQKETEEQTKDEPSFIGKEILFYGEQLSSLGDEVSFYVERGLFYK